MKIGIVSTAAFKDECAHGVSNIINLNSRYIAKKYGAEITIFTPEAVEHPSMEEFDGIYIKRFPFIRFMTDWTISPTLLSAIKKANLDIIHSFHYGYFPATAGFVASKLKIIPHIFTTSYHPSQITSLKTFLMNIYNVTQGQFLLRFSYKVLPQNIDELRNLRKIADFDYEIIPCPLNDDVFYSRVKSEEKIVLYAGALLPWKGAEIAFNICKEIEKEYKNIKFVFIGGGTLEEKLKNQASKRFVFLKNLPVSELAKWFSRASLLLYPTKYESFGRVIGEVMMCGTPVVSTKVGAVPETVGPGGLLVDYGDWIGMKNNVIRILENDKLRRKLSKAAIKHSNQYKYSIVAERIFKIYERALLYA